MLARYRALAENTTHFPGLSIMEHAGQIKKLLDKFEAKTVLDYGCGRGEQYGPEYALHELWGIERPTLYDPAFETHSTLPEGRFDAVLCSDVIEHIPEDEVPAFVMRLFDYADKFVWASICCRPAKKRFKDGLNMHVTLWPFWRWEAKFVKWSRGKPYAIVETR
jgi:hypothetical protein